MDMPKKVIAVDFDGTLCVNKYPEIGKPRKRVIKKLLKEKRNGASIILWTCREGSDLVDAIGWCTQFGIYFDAINDNLPEFNCLFNNNSRKVYANEYWDDKSFRL